MEMDRGNFVGIELIDFRKTFDTMDLFIMHLKLQGTGLADDIAEWIHNYLQINNNLLTSMIINLNWKVSPMVFHRAHC